MGIRTVHNYGGAAIGAGYVAGRGQAQGRRAKYLLDSMRRRQELLQQQMFRRELQEDQQKFWKDRDELQNKIEGDRIGDEREYKAGLDTTRRREDYLRGLIGSAEEAIDEGRYSSKAAGVINSFLDDINKVIGSGVFTDPKKREAALEPLLRGLEDAMGRAIPPPTRSDRLRKGIGDDAFRKYGHLPWVEKGDGDWGLPSGFKMPEDPAEVAKADAEKRRIEHDKTADELAKEREKLYQEELARIQKAKDDLDDDSEITAAEKAEAWTKAGMAVVERINRHRETKMGVSPAAHSEDRGGDMRRAGERLSPMTRPDGRLSPLTTGGGLSPPEDAGGGWSVRYAKEDGMPFLTAPPGWKPGGGDAGEEKMLTARPESEWARTPARASFEADTSEPAKMDELLDVERQMEMLMAQIQNDGMDEESRAAWEKLKAERQRLLGG